MSASASAAEKKFFTRKSLQRGNLVRCEGAGWGGGRAAKELGEAAGGGRQAEGEVGGESGAPSDMFCHLVTTASP